ncbi:MAG TPA: DUF1365 domain-containing protein [Bryobacteraceae bacterium]|nr:DUF1365 domain-containing protein [Bryobacteraceae bacterium]
MESGIYFGKLRHRRFRPKAHQFTYDLFMACLDIDRIPELMKISRFLSYNRFNWASFRERDHFGDARLPLRARLAKDAAAHGISLPAGPIYLLTHLRYLGYNFNPISFFYCYDADSALRVVLAEVNSTFGETHNYWLHPGNEQTAGKARRYECPKTLHVSPFMGMDLDYQFVLTPPGDQLVAHMNTLHAGESFFDATLTLHREPWSARSLRRALLAHPWMTVKVIGAIHWQALRLYVKKVPVFTHPARLRKETPK